VHNGAQQHLGNASHVVFAVFTQDTLHRSMDHYWGALHTLHQRTHDAHLQETRLHLQVFARRACLFFQQAQKPEKIRKHLGGAKFHVQARQVFKVVFLQDVQKGSCVIPNATSSRLSHQCISGNQDMPSGQPGLA
jgi:hypothetical protein